MENQKNFCAKYEKDEFSSHQNFLYRRALFGLRIYSKEELESMHNDKKKRIIKVNRRAQRVLNIWKQELINSTVNDLLSKLFYNSKFVKVMISEYGNYTDTNYISRAQFKELNIDKKQIIDKLIEEKILPSNFYNLE